MEEAHSKFRNMLSVGLPDKDRYLNEKYSTSQLQHILEEYHTRLNLFVNDVAKKWNRQKDIESQHNSSHQNTLDQSLHKQVKETDSNQSTTRPEAHDLSWLSDSHFPVEFLHQMVPAKHVMGHGRTINKRQTENSETHFCTSTTEESNGFLNLCSSCQVTTQLSNNFFPSVLNEIICNPQMNNTCINYRGVSHGVCAQSIFRIQMLRRRPGQCMTVDVHGTTMMVDKWELYSQAVRAGCECKLDKRSALATGATA
ncbi:uncharacterized protein LOC112565166 [Pomacea canaliculata]|uniref:uncharacterized protein LOC112565166 n=1 Tax=Pomacea canaliculata TaxID=400727 RepID=UPI000D73DBA6|nr:uncharacterized protein LOC112565166 [Pomacea canaliculata]